MPTFIAFFIGIFFGTSAIVFGANIPVIPNTKPRIIAVLLPLTGRAGHVGQSIKNSLEIIAFKTASPYIKWQFYDTKSTANGTRMALESMNHPPPHIILGPLFAENTQIVGNATNKNIPVLSFSNTHTSREKHVYYMGYALQPQGKGIAHIAHTLQLRTPLVILPNNSYGHAIFQGFQTLYPSAMVLYYPPAQLAYDDFIQQVQDIKKHTGYDSIVIDDNNPQTLRTLTAQLAFYDAFDTIQQDENQQDTVQNAPPPPPEKIPVIGGTGWANINDVYKENQLVGSYFLTLQDNTKAIATQYKSIYGISATTLSTLAYDLGRLAVGTVQSTTPETYLRNPKGFTGIRGYMRILDNNNIERIYNVYHVRKNTIKWQWKMKIAPTSPVLQHINTTISE